MAFLDELHACAGNVLSGADAAPYGRDWMGKYISSPIAVVRPRSTEEVSAVLALCHAHKTPVVPLGGNTGLTGAGSADDAVIISLDLMNSIRDVQTDARVAIVEAGVVLQNLHDALEGTGLKYPMTFGAKGSCQIGGNLATNAGGSNVLRYGNTRDLCLGLEVVLADGRVLDLMTPLHKDNSGYDLRHLMIGSEGTLGIITAAAMKLVPAPAAYATAMINVPSLDAALTLLNRLQIFSGGQVEAFEYMPADYMARLKTYRPDLTPPLGHDVSHTIFVELGSTVPAQCVEDAEGNVPLVAMLEEALAVLFEEELVTDAALATSDKQRATMWEIREAAAEISTNTLPIVINDLCLPLDKIASFFPAANAAMLAVDANVTHSTVAHLGDGNIHYTVYPSREDPQVADALMEAVEDVVESLGGSFSAEHGIGLAKRSSMARRKSDAALDSMRAIKSALDPHNILNPGKTLP